MPDNELVEALRSTTIRCKVTSAALGLSRTDKQATKDITAQSGAVSGAARVVVSRLAGADEHHKRIIAAQSQARQVLNRMSMPFGDEEGWRILPNANFMRFMKEFGIAKKVYNDAFAALEKDADTVLEQARANKGSFAIDVPTKDELLSAYSLDFAMEDYPVGNFTGLPEAVATKLSVRHERRLEQALQQAHANTIERFVEPLTRFVERMESFSKREEALSRGEEPGRVGIFRDSVVGNIKELYDVLDSFNVGGDERLTELGNLLASLANVAPDALRDNVAVREASIERAHTALANLNSWLSPPPAQQQAA